MGAASCVVGKEIYICGGVNEVLFSTELRRGATIGELADCAVK